MISCTWAGNDSRLLAVSFEIRRLVFIEEQHVPKHLEYDELDRDAMHLLLYEDAIAVGCGRIVLLDTPDGNEFLIGRIAVIKEKRGLHYGDFIVRTLVRKAFECGATAVRVHAQTRALGFYKKLGFEPYGSEFDDAGIPHIAMRRTADFNGCCH